ncbi:MAG: hypothetical protein COX57_12875 [Alphaproteobacteria bacterium CG_4_10_14_0_2_um_filter_63_37]|nr:MAG: hypothetical protein AUJ55_11795 [Proteobacteria bacterium CG1_02_64_396]PJA23600.1 MAG: hypothetical protein COX57_12875 [Alphaproteobacteria bacterium CG_4_10_14_0_2_um_filter_63_37]
MNRPTDWATTENAAGVTPGGVCVWGGAGVVPWLFFVSGLSSLAFELLWVRQVIALTGLPLWGVGVVIAAFMGGLGLGGWTLRHRLTHLHPLRLYGLFEGAIGLLALLMPLWLGGVAALALHLPDHPLVALLLWLLALAPATVLMGATLPVLLRLFPFEPAATGRLYAVNACGGALGALLPDLLLLPALGLHGAQVVVALLPLTVGGIAWWLSRRAPPVAADVPPPAATLPPTRWLVAYGLCGAATVAVEVVWTRWWSLLVDQTATALALILAVFIAGIAAGSAWGRHRSDEPGRLLVILIALLALPGLGMALLGPLVRAVEPDIAPMSLLLLGGLLALLLVGPATFVMGWLFPAVVRAVGGGGAAAGALYGVNALGGVVGTLAIVLLLPDLGSKGAALLLSILLAASALLWNPRRWLALPAALAGGVIWLPGLDPLMTTSDPLFVARQATVQWQGEDATGLREVAQDAQGVRYLINGRRHWDASLDAVALRQERRLGIAPVAWAGGASLPERALYLGMGSGITASGAVLLDIRDVTILELSPAAIAGAEKLGTLPPGATVIPGDLRRFLLRSTALWPLIVGDLFHPDLAGAGNLYAVEHFELVGAHLTDDGLFVQWLALNQFDPEALRTAVASFMAAFPQGEMHLMGVHLALLSRPARIAEFPWPAEALRRSDLSGHRDLATRWCALPSLDKTLASAPRQRLGQPILEQAAFRLRATPEMERLGQNLKMLLSWWQQGAGEPDRLAIAAQAAATMQALAGSGEQEGAILYRAWEGSHLPLVGRALLERWQADLENLADNPDPRARQIEAKLKGYVAPLQQALEGP